MNPVSKTVQVQTPQSTHKQEDECSDSSQVNNQAAFIVNFLPTKGAASISLPRSHLISPPCPSIKITCQKLPISLKSQLSPGTCAKCSTICPTFQDHHVLYNLLKTTGNAAERALLDARGKITLSSYLALFIRLQCILQERLIARALYYSATSPNGREMALKGAVFFPHWLETGLSCRILRTA